MKNRFFGVVLLLFLLTALTGNAQAIPLMDPGSPLIVVHLGSSTDLDRFALTGLPMFALLDEALLTSTDQAGQATLQSVGLRFEVVDQDPASGTYYLAGTRARREPLDFGLYGQVLFTTGQTVLLRMDPSRAEALTQAGAEVSLITLVPKPLPKPQAGANFPQVVDPDPLIQQMVDQVQLSQVSAYDRQLAGELPVWVDGDWYTITTRNTYSGTPIQKATHYVGQHMANDLGLDVEYHVWNSTTNPNVIGEIAGQINPENIFIIGAHIDDVNNTPGADDNASGSVATLLAADILSQYDWGCTLRFAFWTGEEQGLLGSQVYAQRSSQRGENIVGYLNLDMIAYNTPLSSPDIDILYNANMPPTLALAQLYADVIAAYNINLIPGIGTSLGGGSDHSSFWNYGYTSILAIEDQGDFNPYYHGPGDTPAHTDLTYFTNFVKASIGTYAHMSGCLIPGGLGTLDGHITAAAGGTPIEDATVTAEDTQGHLFTTTTDASGYYTRTLMSGAYTVTASAYSYLSSSVSGVEVITDTLTTQNFSLSLAPTYTVSGIITEAGTGSPLLATINFIGSPVVVTSDPLTGFYTATLPKGTYTMQVSADLHNPQERDIVLDHDQTQNFALAPLPCILLVDDDNNSPDTRPFYAAALNNLGYEYNVFDTAGGAGPDASALEGYRMVLWFSGDVYGGTSSPKAGPNGVDEINLSTYLNAGGKLFLDSQDYLYDMHLTAFGQNYLGVASYTDDSGNASTKYGVAGDPVGGGLGPYTLSYPAGFSDYGDIVYPATAASVAFRSLASGGNNLDLDKDEGDWQTVFFATSWVPIYNNNPSNGEQALHRIIDFFGGCALPPAVSIEPPSQAKIGEPGTQVSYTYTVANTGGSAQDVHMSLNSVWPTLVSPDFTGVLHPGESTPVTVTVTIPMDLAVISDTFTLHAQGLLGGADSATGTTTADVSPGVEVLAPADGMGQPLETVPYQFTVTNTGDYTDTFTLQVNGIWNATLPGGDSTGSLAAGASLPVTVLVQVPGEATDSEADTTALVATSHLDPNVSASASVTTTALVYDIAIDPLTQEKSGLPGAQVSYVYTLTNLASAPQEVLLSVTGNNWLTEAPASTDELAAHASTTVTVVVTIPNIPEWIIAQDSFTLLAEGAMGGTASATGTTLANVTPGVNVTSNAGGYVRPGEVIGIAFEITNSGNYTDTFTLQLSGLWPATIEGGNIIGPMPPGGMGIKFVIVEVPANTPGGFTGITTLTATSTLDPDIFAKADVTLVAWHVHYLPFVIQ